MYVQCIFLLISPSLFWLYTHGQFNHGFGFLLFRINLIFHCSSVDLDLGPSLRQICAANRSDEKQVIWSSFSMLSYFNCGFQVKFILPTSSYRCQYKILKLYCCSKLRPSFRVWVLLSALTSSTGLDMEAMYTQKMPIDQFFQNSYQRILLIFLRPSFRSGDALSSILSKSQCLQSLNQIPYWQCVP